MADSNGRRGPEVGERVYFGRDTLRADEWQCVFVASDDTNIVADDRVLIRQEISEHVAESRVCLGPFDYLCDSNGRPFRGFL